MALCHGNTGNLPSHLISIATFENNILLLDFKIFCLIYILKIIHFILLYFCLICVLFHQSLLLFLTQFFFPWRCLFEKINGVHDYFPSTFYPHSFLLSSLYLLTILKIYVSIYLHVCVYTCECMLTCVSRYMLLYVCMEARRGHPESLSVTIHIVLWGLSLNLEL